MICMVSMLGGIDNKVEGKSKREMQDLGCMELGGSMQLNGNKAVKDEYSYTTKMESKSKGEDGRLKMQEFVIYVDSVLGYIGTEEKPGEEHVKAINVLGSIATEEKADGNY